MKTIRHTPRSSRISHQPWLVLPAAFLSTLLALPVNAGITIPDEPLTTGNRVAPNILFILDDSGSMAFNYMPDSVPATTTIDISKQAYPRNTLSYNPFVTYQAWMQANGNRMTGGTSYTAAYGSFNLAPSTTINLGDSSSCKYFNYNSNSTTDENVGTQVCGGVQTYYVPKDPSDDSTFGDGKNYWRYQIQTNGSSIVRSEYGAPTFIYNALAVSPSSGTVYGTGSNTHLTNLVPANMKVTISIESTARSVLYWMYDPNGAQICSGQVNGGNTQACNSQPSVAGKYKIVTKRWDNTNSNADYVLTANYSDTNRCDGGFGAGNTWINCTAALPNTERTLAQELSNYATWFSYHRTRIKSAKAGASDAFRPLGNKVRVGFRTIWGRGANHSTPIPVTKGDGRFIDDPTNSVSNRTAWYSALQSVIGYNGTPLKGGLQQAGKYFSGDATDGAYGPEVKADQYSCRQNFAILTTDGYWNSDNDYTAVNEQDNNNGTTITGPGGKSYTYTAKAPYSSADSNTLADVAMRYWKNDLRTDLTNNVPAGTDDDSHPKNGDPAFWQHMVTFGISIGLSGTSGWGSVDDVPQNATWNNPNDAEDSDRIDDLLHAAVNGHGAFVAATSPSEFTQGLSKALAVISQRTSSFSNVATNAASIKTGGKVFNASYISGIWTGAVKAWDLDSNNNPSTSAWIASIPAAASRNVFTWSGASGSTFPTSTQITALDRSSVGPVDYPVSGANNAAYIKGDASLEERNGGILRNRITTVLGDIVNSSPAYVDETKTLYVGANDGMLHAFDAEDGKELFAYVPSLINFADLSLTSRPDYTHKWFVDGPIAVTTQKQTSSKNLLVGGLGRGGKGLYGLDVTNPSTFGASNVTWELKETAGNNMGLITGRIMLASVKNGAGTTMAAVVGNGMNSTNDKAVLLVVNVATGSVIREIDTGAGSSSTPNGLSAPTGILGPDGKSLAYVYAGDRLGNVWKFDLTNTSPSSWSVKKLFTAKKDGTGAVQPISAAVTVATEPRTYKRWVFFGTGSYMTTTESDDRTADAQSMYGFIDSDAEVNYSDLVQRGFSATTGTSDGYPVRGFESKADLPNNKQGWYINLPGKGERIVVDAQVVSNILLTASMIPDGDACEASGTGYINALDAFTGTSAGSSFFDLDGNPNTNNTVGGVPVGSVNFGVGMPTLPVILDGKLIVGGTGGATGSDKPGSGGIVKKTWGRVSWREIRND